MNILYLVPHIPNPTKARSYFQIRGLVEAGHHVTVATLKHRSKDAEHIINLERTGCSVIAIHLPKTQALANSLWAVTHWLPVQARFKWSTALMERIEQFLRENPPDVIHVEH